MNININKHYSTLQSNEFEELKFEYDNLRKEILHNEIVGTQLMGFALVIVAGGMGYVLKSSDSSLIKITTLSGIIGFLTFVVLQNLDKVKMTFLIASYLRHYIEPKPNNVKWETRINKFRKTYEREMGISRYNNVILTYLIIAASNLVLMFFYTFKDENQLKSINFLTTLFVYKITNYNVAIALILICILISLFIWIYSRKKLIRFIHKNDELEDKWKIID